MTRHRFPLARSLASLFIVLLILQSACAPPAPPVSPEVTTPGPEVTEVVITTPGPEITTEAPPESPTPTAPESTTETPAESSTPTATAGMPEGTEEYNLPEVSTEWPDCVFLEGIKTTAAAEKVSAEDSYIRDQIMLNGEPGHIAQVVPAFSDRIVAQGPNEGRIDQLPPDFVERTGSDVQLYLTNPGVSIPDLVRDINQYAIDTVQHPDAGVNGILRVFAEPNYITRLPAGVTVGNPAGDGGSGIHGDPDPNSVLSPAPYGHNQFIRQWAFSWDKGIRLFDANNPHNWTPGPYTGAGARIVVFDTTPLPEGDHVLLPRVAPFHLCVWQPGLRFTETTMPDPTDPFVRIPKEEHGLFVSGMAHGLAPAAETYLIEVLDSAARGDAYTLVRAIALYLTHPFADPNNIETVFNLSLGLENHQVDPAMQEAIAALIEDIKSNYLPDPTQDRSGLLELADLADAIPVVSLKIALQSAEEAGVVVVASAGNDSSISQQAPANFSHVLGVASTNFGAAETCFTNPGDVAAPSGDSFDDVDGDGTFDSRSETCEEDIPKLCAGKEDCQAAVISNVRQSGMAPSGFAYWTGTSFSAPMASGLAALILEKNGALNPLQVRDAIICGVTPASSLPAPRDTLDRRGAGLIDVENTLNSCVPLSPTPTPTP